MNPETLSRIQNVIKTKTLEIRSQLCRWFTQSVGDPANNREALCHYSGNMQPSGRGERKRFSSVIVVKIQKPAFKYTKEWLIYELCFLQFASNAWLLERVHESLASARKKKDNDPEHLHGSPEQQQLKTILFSPSKRKKNLISWPGSVSFTKTTQSVGFS